MRLNIFRINAVSPRLLPANPGFNVEKLKEAYQQALVRGASLVLFPAFATTGKSCGVLFKQPYMLEAVEHAIEEFAAVISTS